MLFTDPHYYDYLQISRNAEQEVIDGAYMRLVKKYHPDNIRSGSGDEDRIKYINMAYHVLKDPAKRKEYDAWLASYDSNTAPGNNNENQSSAVTLEINWSVIKQEAGQRYREWQRYAKRSGKKKGPRIISGVLLTAALAAIVIFGVNRIIGRDMDLLSANNTTQSDYDDMRDNEQSFIDDGRNRTTPVSETSGNGTVDVQPETVSAGDRLIIYEVTGNSVNVRSTPGVDGEKLGKINKGEHFKGTGNMSADGAWIEIEYPNGLSTGWTSSSYLTQINK